MVEHASDNEGKPRVFISHAHHDEALVRKLARELEAAGYIPWTYEEQSLVGSSYLAQILDAIERAAAIVVVVSPRALGSFQMDSEIKQAYETQRPMLPLLIGLSHGEMREQRREWAMMFGTAVSLAVPAEGVGATMPQIVAGLERLGVAGRQSEIPTPQQPSTPGHASNLPAQPTTFIGREREVKAVAGLLRQKEVRLLTLTGPGGTGKTRLAVQVAAQLVDHNPHGVFFVSLASVGDAELVVSAIAAVLGLKETGERPLFETISAHLAGKTLLLVLDNLEHLPEAAPLVGDLLAASSGLTILATSQAVLRLTAEREYPVPSFALPDKDARPEPEALARYDAVAFFVDRARTVKPDFVLTADNATAVVEICRKLDGLPLAMELAAARLRIFPPQALLSRLENRLKLLTGGARDRPTRQQTLRGAIDWSYELLNREEQTLFARLGVFAAGCSFEAVEAVCNADGEHDILEGLESLVAKSLVRQEGEDEPRFLMLDTIREYAEERLEHSGEADRMRQSHAEYYYALVEDTRQWEGPRLGEWMERVEMEHDNLRAALGWAVQTRQAALGLPLAGRMWRFWEDHGYLSEGRRWLKELLDLDGEVAASARARALQGAGWLASLQGDYEQASTSLDAGLRLSREAGDERLTASVLTSRGALEQIHGNYAEAIAWYDESIAVYHGLGDTQGAVRPRHNLAMLAHIRGDYERAQSMFAENVREMRKAQNTRLLARSLESLALTLFSQRQYDQARPMLEESLELARGLGDRRHVASSLHNLGCVVMGQGEPERAQRLYEEALALARDMEDSFRMAACLESIGALAIDQGETEWAREALSEGLETAQSGGYRKLIAGLLEQFAGLVALEGRPARAAKLYGAAQALREELGAPRPAEEEEHYQAQLDRARSQVGEAEWSAAWDDGQGMELAQAISYAREGVSEPV